ncbi:hypothetical protein AMATHDRAFT_10675 [Amanita thiersii Skay4041]|uniref:NADP-dependent oxidoreductase domain-containing protein n=1 Tax=Amanita thiersii Skay4041 TaxID=703135 RepID=A0A2A9NAU2_9AGAR|nr:hypothetical protein AMATHDRAFT_10675 [Amanita thiersii Skay4041]
MPSSLLTRKVGNTAVTAIGFGLMGLSAFYGQVGSDEERFKVLDAVFEEGCTFWDTADIYGDSEDLVGKWFKRTGKRDEIFLATKFGISPTRELLVNGEPEYRADPLVPIERTVGAMAELVKAGKVKYLGLSEISANTLRRAHAVHPIAAVQVDYSPFVLDIRSLDEFEPDDFRRAIPMNNKKNFPNILKLVDDIKSIGARHGATAGPGDTSLGASAGQGHHSDSGH